MTQTQWRVGATQGTIAPGMPEGGYSFSIQDQHGALLLTISYRTEAAARLAEEAVRDALRHAIDIRKH